MQYSSSIPYMQAGLSPPKGSDNGFSFSDPGQMSNMRLSSTLQDFSLYCKLGSEGGDPNGGIDVINAKPPHSVHRDMSSLSFSKDKGAQVYSFTCKKWIRILMILLCLLIFGFFLIILCGLVELPSSMLFLIVGALVLGYTYIKHILLT